MPIIISTLLFLFFLSSNLYGEQTEESTCGKDSLSEKFEFVENCFAPYSVRASLYFDGERDILSVIADLGKSKLSSYLKFMGIHGYISKGRSTHEIERITPEALLTFTGAIIKYCPDTVGYEMGSRENASRICRRK